MKISFFIIILVVFTANSCNPQQSNDEKMNYSIEITNFYFGRIDCITILTNDSIKSEINRSGGEYKAYKRNLNDKEKQKVEKFIKKFPLTKLKNQYINETVEDGTQIKFILRIENNEKSIYISNEYQEDLGDLVELVVSLLPEDYIGYNKQTIQW